MKNRLILYCLLLVCLVSCSESPELPLLSPGATVLAFGDSLTRGTGASTGQSYPEVLAGMTGLNIINAGIPGEVSAEGRARLPALLDEHVPALLILCHGGNDLLQKKPEAAAAANLLAMIEAAGSRNIPVVMLGVPRPAIFLNTADFYDEVAEATGVVYVPDVIGEVLGEADLRADVAHPNAAGYRIIAEAVDEVLREAGAL